MEDDNTVDTLLQQLSDFPRQKMEKRVDDELEDLSGENLEKFILKNAGRLVRDSIDSVENMKDFIDSAPDAESSEALASLIKSATASIDILQRIMIAREKNQSAKEITQMKIESQEIQTDKEIHAKLLLSREEAIKALVEAAPTIDTEIEIVDN